MYALIDPFFPAYFLCTFTSVKSNLQVFRAKFSEITPNSIRRACETLTEPDCNISDAVDVRQELDLRIGTQLLSTSAVPHTQTRRPGLRNLTSLFHASALLTPSRLCRPFFFFFRCVLHSIPDPPPAEDLPRVSGQSAHFLRQLSVSHSGFCGGAFQSHPGFHTRDLLQDQRCAHILPRCRC